MHLFVEQNFKVRISPEALLIPEFQALAKRDKTKDKLKAIADLAFVYFYTDYKSPYSKFTEQERLAAVNKEVGFPIDQKMDSHLKKAVEKYAELQETPSIRSLIAIRESLMTSTRVIELLKTQVDDALNAIPPEDDEEDTTPVDTARLVDTIQQLLKLSDMLPKAITTIEQLEEKVKKEQSSERKIKGGGVSNHFED